MLSKFGFTIQYISIDGAQRNRDIFHILLFNSSNLIACSFHNVFSPKLNEIFFLSWIFPILSKQLETMCQRVEMTLHAKEMFNQKPFKDPCPFTDSADES